MVSLYLWWFWRSTCLEILSFAAMDRSLWPYAAADRQSVRQFCQMIVGVSNTNARIEDRSDWLIQQLQPEPLHPWQKTEPTSFLFQIYNLEAWEPLQEKMWNLMEQKMCYVCFSFCLLFFCFYYVFCLFFWFVFLGVVFLVCFFCLFFIILIIFNFPMNEGLSTSSH